MSSEKVDYEAKAEADAWDAIDNFEDDIREQLIEGEASDDLNNDYHGGDEYHHENHVDASYDLQEAASLLDDLGEYEETDTGLWEGLQPREAISAQAAYTYGNAVMGKFQEAIREINAFFERAEDAWDFPDGWRKHFVPLVWPVIVRARLGRGLTYPVTDTERGLLDRIRGDFEQEEPGELVDAIGVLLDYYEGDAGKADEVATCRELYQTWRRFCELQEKRKEGGYDEMVAGPGKFENEPAYIPYFYERILEGMADDGDSDGQGNGWDSCDVTDDDRLMFPELDGQDEVIVCSNDQGFVSEGHSKPAYEAEE